MKLLAAALAAAALLTGTALAATPERVVASKTTTGGFALAKTAATVATPSRIRVRAFASPRQSVLLSWRVSCTKGGKTVRDVRQYPPAVTPTTRTVALPILRAARCTVAATGQLEHGEGRITVSILASRR